MKRLKSLMAVSLILLMICSLVACSENNSGTASNEKEVTSTVETIQDKGETKENSSNDIKKDVDEQNDEADSEKEDSEELSNKEKERFTIPGYQLGEIPPIPLIEVPTVQEQHFKTLYSDEQKRVMTVIEEGLSTVSGIRVEPAIFTGDNIVYMPFSSDGSGSYADLSGNNSVFIEKNADGKDTYTDLSGDKGVFIEKNKDGSGSQTDLSGDNSIHIEQNEDGSGTYTDLSSGKSIFIERNADGSGKYTDLSGENSISIERNADGSGKYSDLSGENSINIERNADGSGKYTDLSGENNLFIEINDISSGSYSNLTSGVNYEYIDANTAKYSDDNLTIEIKDGFAKITENEEYESIEVEALPLSKLHLIDELPPIQELPDIGNVGDFEIRGFRIIFDNAILFDFSKHELREEGKAAIKLLVDKINELGIQNIEIHGHTDSISDDAYNQTLSEKRAASAYDYALEAGLNSKVTSIGYGESKPIAPNNNADGSDNPAGRQANRRVEFFIPVQ